MSIWTNWNNGGLGDYVHLCADNYRKYGIYRQFGSSENFTQQGSSSQQSVQNAAIAAYQDARNIAKKTKTTKAVNVKTIEDFYTSLMRKDYQGASNAVQKNLIDYEKMENAIAEVAEQKLSNSIGKTIDRATLGVTNIGNLKRIQYSGLKDKKRQSIQKPTLIKISRQVKECINTLIIEFYRGKTSGINAQSLSNLEKTIVELKKIRKNLTQIIANMSRENEFLTPFRDVDEQLNPLGDTLAMIDYLTKSYAVPTKEDFGIVGEIFAAGGAAAAGNIISDVTTDLLKTFVVGGKDSSSATTIKLSTFVDTNVFLDTLNKKTVGGESAQWRIGPDGNTVISGHTSQDTVDISINFEDDDNIFGTDKLRASVKNYFNPANEEAQHPGVSVISGIPFTSVLNLIGTNFSNHYLNYLVGHGEGDFEYMENILKYALAVRGISGARNAAFEKLSQYFIVFSRSQMRAYVFTTMDLLDKISPAEGIFNNEFASVKGFPQAGSLNAANAKVPISTTQSAAVQQRIANVLVGAHAFKLSMSLTPKVFT